MFGVCDYDNAMLGHICWKITNLFTESVTCWEYDLVKLGDTTLVKINPV